MCEVFDALARQIGIEGDLTAEQVGRNAAEQNVGIGDGGSGPTVAVTHGAGIGSGRMRPDAQRALGCHPGDRAAARADGDDVDHRDLRRVVADASLGGQRGLAADHDGHVGGGAATVAGQHLFDACRAGHQGRTQRAGGRPGEHGGDGLVHNLFRGQNAAVGLHDVERHVACITGFGGELPQAVRDVVDVAPNVRLDGRVDQCGDGALEFAVLAQHLGGDGDRRLGVFLEQDVADTLFMVRVGVGVHQADAEGLDALCLEECCGRAHIVVVEGADLVAVEREPATNGADAVRGHDAIGLDPEVGVAVAVGYRLARDLEYVLVALGGDEPQVLHLAFEQLVGSDSGAVADGAERIAGYAELAQYLVDAGQESLGRITRRRRSLGGHHGSGLLVHCHDVGECATGVDTDPNLSWFHASSSIWFVGHASVDRIGGYLTCTHIRPVLRLSIFGTRCQTPAEHLSFARPAPASNWQYLQRQRPLTPDGWDERPRREP